MHLYYCLYKHYSKQGDILTLEDTTLDIDLDKLIDRTEAVHYIMSHMGVVSKVQAYKMLRTNLKGLRYFHRPISPLKRWYIREEFLKSFELSQVVPTENA